MLFLVLGGKLCGDIYFIWIDSMYIWGMYLCVCCCVVWNKIIGNWLLW